MHTGDLIKRYRKEKRLTQKELADKVNLTSQVISNIERNYTSISTEDLKNIAKVLNVTPNQLLDTKKEINNAPDWATQDDLVKLEEMLKSNTPMAYNGVELNEEDKERINAVLTQVFWERLKEQKQT